MLATGYLPRAHKRRLNPTPPTPYTLSRRYAQLERFVSFEANPMWAPGFAKLDSLWRHTLTPADCTHPMTGHGDTPLRFSPTDHIFHRSPFIYAAYAYDAVAALVLALQASANAHNASHVLRALTTVQFDGATGRVAFDNSTRDRAIRGQIYTISSFAPTAGREALTLEPVRLIVSCGATPLTNPNPNPDPNPLTLTSPWGPRHSGRTLTPALTLTLTPTNRHPDPDPDSDPDPDPNEPSP